MSESAKVFRNPTQGKLLSSANSKFALDLYKLHSLQSTDQNLFMSPLSISFALAMTHLGARGRTMSQMSEVLHFIDVDQDSLHQAFNDIQAAINKPQQAYKLYVANRLFGEKSYTFLDEFLAASRKHYGAALAPVDFRNDSRGSAATINSWVSEKTVSKVTEIVTSSDIDPDTRLVLVNAIYFKGDWKTKFRAENTRDADFHVSATKTTKVPMMYINDDFYYGVNNSLKCQALELPYAGDNLSMFIILPDKSTSLAEVEAKLTSADLVGIKESFRMSLLEVEVWLPKFRLDEMMSLAESLAVMGMEDLFSESLADLSGIDGTQMLYVSKVLHRAVIDVNEDGTEAAAATAVFMTFCAMRTKEFRADRPFLFFIQDKATNSVLFLGRLARPSS